MGNNIISSLGAGSGIDIKGLVDGLVSVERSAPEQRLDTKKTKLEAQISGYGTLSSSIDEFKKVVDPLTNPDLFNARSASFPSTNQFITANGIEPDAQTGTFNVKVNQTAQSQSLSSAVVADPAAQLLSSGDGTQQLTIRFGDWASYTAPPGAGPVGFTPNASKATVTVNITEGKSSLNDIAQAINDANSGLEASVLDDGSGQYKLLLTSPSGDKNSVEISVSDPKLSLVEFKQGSASLTQNQESKDAIIEVNGLTVQRESNTINDVVNGFDFTLNKASAGEVVTFSIEEDRATAEQAIRDFVTAYNTFYETANNLIGVTKSEETGASVAGQLSSDGTAKTIVSSIVNAKSEKLAASSGAFSYLANLGIETKLDGTIEIDEEKFSKVLKDNFEDVAKLLARSTSSTTSSIEVGTKSSTVPQDGTYTVVVTQDPTKAKVVTGATAIGFPLNTGVGGLYSFQASLHGTDTSVITLPDNQVYNTGAEIAAALQSAINGDAAIKADQSLGVVVSFDNGTGSFTFESNSYGQVSNDASIKLKNLSATFDTTFKASSGQGAVETAGQNVAGTINGESAFGTGNILLANIGSASDGLLLTISPGAVAAGSSTITFSSGFAGGLVSTMNAAVIDKGSIDVREERINDQLTDIEEDRKQLDERMSKLEIRYYNQFLAMEAIINGLNGTSSQLDNILKTLPFTADRN